MGIKKRYGSQIFRCFLQGKAWLFGQVSCDGLANSKRALAITTKTGKVLFTQEYTSADSSGSTIDVDESIVFSYNGNEITLKYDQTPSPLVVELGDIIGSYVQPVKVDAPSIVAMEISKLDPSTDLNISVTDTNLGIENIISGEIIIDGTNSYDLAYDENGELLGVVSATELPVRDSFTYQVSIFDGVNTAKTEERTVVINGAQADVDQTKAPVLTITELLPDSSNVNGTDAYEYIEIYNNSDTDINLKFLILWIM